MSSCMWALLDIVGEEEIEKEPSQPDVNTGACEAVISGSDDLNKGTSNEEVKVRT
jgi:hypothetical protein